MSKTKILLDALEKISKDTFINDTSPMDMCIKCRKIADEALAQFKTDEGELEPEVQTLNMTKDVYDFNMGVKKAIAMLYASMDQTKDERKASAIALSEMFLNKSKNFISAQPSGDNNSGLRWVKVSEQLPGKRHNYFVKMLSHGRAIPSYIYNSTCLFDGKEFVDDINRTELRYGSKVVEWLSESQPEDNEAVELWDELIIKMIKVWESKQHLTSKDFDFLTSQFLITRKSESKGGNE